MEFGDIVCSERKLEFVSADYVFSLRHFGICSSVIIIGFYTG